MSSQNRNPTGKNQYGAVLKADDERLVSALTQYHREKLTNNEEISKRLAAEHDIKMRPVTVKRRRKALGLVSSRTTQKTMSVQERTQLVISQMDKDPARRHGKDTIMRKIAADTGIHISRDFVSQVMHDHDPEGFRLRGPTAKKAMRHPKAPDMTSTSTSV